VGQRKGPSGANAPPVHGIKKCLVSTHETFLRYVNERFEIGNPDYIGVSQRLKGLPPNELLELGAQWHRNCYCETTDKNKLERDKKRYQMNSENNLKGKGPLRQLQVLFVVD
jgi:hypothetical protein